MKSVIINFCLFAVLFISTFGVDGKILNRCQIARELVKNGLPRHQIGDWVCLVESESSGNTGVVGGPNSDGSKDYGLFQMNDRYWCKVGYRGGVCNEDCNSFLDNDIRNDIKCVNKIFSIHGFRAWYGWINKCQGRPFNVNHCF